jgi:hypothetical protein
MFSPSRVFCMSTLRWTWELIVLKKQKTSVMMRRVDFIKNFNLVLKQLW